MIAVARTALEAWKQLEAKGGIERDGRDADFVHELTEALRPGADTIEQALAMATIDQFVAAMFETIGPFAAIYTDILAFFGRAGAKDGKAAWTLQLGEVPFDLEHFVQFVETAQTVLGVRRLKMLTGSTAWTFRHALNGSSGVSALPSDVIHWCERWDEGTYAAYPASLTPARIAPELGDAAAIANAALQTIRSVSQFRDDPTKLVTARTPIELAPLGGLGAIEIADLDKDLWLRSVIVGLGHAVVASEAERMRIAAAVAAVIGGLPSVPVPSPMSQLEKLVSLPAWKHRYDLYAVWVATAILGALPDHPLEIHTDRGALPFAFKSHLLATVETLEGETFLHSERKSKLADPRGKGRKKNVQPDYGLWRPNAECRLVIEVKHYKTADKRRFSEVMADYADAHPDAEVLLVNYAGTGDILDIMPGVDAGVRDRCHHIPHLTPHNFASIDRFRQMVLDAVGPPPPRPVRQLVLLDVSASMMPALSGGRNSVAASWLQSDEVDPDCEVVFVDTMECWRGSVEQAVDQLHVFAGNRGTSLSPVALQLLEDTDLLLVATDGDGLDDLATEGLLSTEKIGYRTNFWVARTTARTR